MRQAFERMHNTLTHTVKTYVPGGTRHGMSDGDVAATATAIASNRLSYAFDPSARTFVHTIGVLMYNGWCPFDLVFPSCYLYVVILD